MPVDGVALTHLPAHSLRLLRAHPRQGFQMTEWKIKRDGAVGHIADRDCELALAPAPDELKRRVEHRGEHPRILLRDAARELDARIGREALLQLRRQLADILMRQHHADIVFARLLQDHRDVLVEIIGAFVDIDEGGEPLPSC